ncbi:MAG: hypothetical protein OEX81_01300 [Candidatus Pacebacteria bacterium]|nr:hypothetical protein [Candidatus Paceibacterota bacterium]
MKSSHYTCELFSTNILLMASSQMEFYRNGDNGKLDINWNGQINGGTEIFHQSYTALKLINKALIVAHFESGTGSTCLRMILQITREAKLLGVETRVVFPNKEQFDAAEVTGFSSFYKTFLTEIEALEDLDITDFYPLALVNLTGNNPDPIAA